jgi:RHS repeat-associated protein
VIDELYRNSGGKTVARLKKVGSISIALAMVVLLLPAVPAMAQVPSEQLTLSGPTTTTMGQSTSFSGTLKLGPVGIPAQQVELRVDGVPAGSTGSNGTATDGSYSIPVVFKTYGLHQLRAVARPGSPLQVQSNVMTVEAVPLGDGSVATDIYESTKFIYTGTDAPQTGVAVNTIKADRVAVVRGAISDPAGNPIEGVKVTIPGQTQYGQSLSTDEGNFDLALNGGATEVVRIAKPGFLPVERRVTTDWRGYSTIPEVVLTPLDAAKTTVPMNQLVMQVARGSQISDADGARRATLLFPAGTHASMRLPDGSTQTLSSLGLRATEYTVGSDGPEKMPAELPVESAYTYAVDFTADEAIAAGATSVDFDKAVPTYVENFIGFPVGKDVPAGYYDSTRHSWVPASDGRVVEVVSITLGKADLDVDGDGSADTGTALTSLGITDAERTKLATLYSAGTELWRVPVTHFTPWDYNFSWGLPWDADFPSLIEAAQDNEQPCEKGGSIIGCESQVLSEEIPLAGTPFYLRYDSNRAFGRKVERSLEIPLTEASIPASLKRVTLDVSVAGRSFSYTHDPSANLRQTFTWDGKDAYGRLAQGGVSAHIRIGYVYDGVRYQSPKDREASFGGAPENNLASSPFVRAEFAVYQNYDAEIGRLYRSGLADVAGWSLSAHHAYDPNGRALLLGNGQRKVAEALVPAITKFAGTGDAGPNGQGTCSTSSGPALQNGLGQIEGLDVGPDGSLYIADPSCGVVRRVSPGGTMSIFAGGGTSGRGDGGPATQAELITPRDVAVGPDGVYILDAGDARVRRVTLSGTISTVAGGGFPADGLGDDGPALSAKLSQPRGIALGPNGDLYIADTNHDRVRQVNPGGLIRTIAGGGTPVSGVGDGGPATKAKLSHPADVTVARDGRVFISDPGQSRIRVVRSDGIISTYAGTGVSGGTGDGGPATQALLGFPIQIDFDEATGSLHIADHAEHSVRVVDAQGILNRIAGTGTSGASGDTGAPAAAKLDRPEAVAIGNSGEVFVGDTGSFRVRKIDRALPGFSTTDYLIPDGGALYQFNSAGRHLKTLDALTGATIYTFAYDTSGRLTTVSDDYGNTTTIQRNGAGAPTAVVGPFGQTTELGVNSDGYLSLVTDANDDALQLDYGNGGLLTGVTTPRASHTFTYDDMGRLTRDDRPAGGATTLDRALIQDGHRVTTTTAEGSVTTYKVEHLTSGKLRRTIIDSAGGETKSVADPDGTVTLTSSDGTITTLKSGPDPRWGMAVPILSSMTSTTLGGKSQTVTATRSVTLSNASDPLSLTAQTDALTLNSKTWTSAYNASGKTITATSPEGRTVVTTLDAQGKAVETKAGTLASTFFAYDAKGRLETITQGSGAGSRVTQIAYKTNGFVDWVENAKDERTTISYDNVGRVLSETLPDTESIGYSYDSVGNLKTLTPPDKTAHSFDYTTGDQLETYTPPTVADSGPTSHDYTADRELDVTTQPTSETVDLGYDSARRLSSAAFSRGSIGYTYVPNTSKLAGITAPSGQSLSFSYDGPLVTGISAAGAGPGSVGYGYSADLRVDSRTINGGNSVAYGYSNDGLLTSAGAMSLVWHAQNGTLSSTALGTVNTSNNYNSFGEPDTETATSGANSLYSVDYDRDDLGRITTKTEIVEGVTTVYAYTYDNRGRLTNATKDGAAWRHYEYDANGNRTSATEDGNTVSGSYDAQDRLTGYGSVAYTYDAMGQLASKTVGSDVTTYDYDELGNLMQVVLPNKTIDYVVDAQGRRVARKVDGTTTNRYLYGQGVLPIAELNADGTVKSQFVFGSKGQVPEYMMRNGTNYRFVTDQVGSVRLVVNSTDGTVAQRIDYDPFGKVVSDTNPGFQPFGFAGGLFDSETDLVRFGFRDYEADVGRWLRKDPVGFSGDDTNLYAYVNSDPVNNLDPSGLLCILGSNADGSCHGGGVYTWSVMHLNPMYHAVEGYYAEADAIMRGCPLTDILKGAAQGVFWTVATGAMVAGGEGSAVGGIDASELTFTESALHADRAYQGSSALMQEIIRTGRFIPDETVGAWKWIVSGSAWKSGINQAEKEAAQGVWELVIDPAGNRVLHFLFRS